MTNNNPDAQYYQAGVTDLTSSNERLTEQNAQRLEHLERLRAECVDLRTIVSVCNLYLAAMEGRTLHEPNDLLLDLTQRVNAYLETKKVTQ